MAAPIPGNCKGCGISTTKKCSGCSEGVDMEGLTTSTHYCSTECQQADFAVHKGECRKANNRKQLYRGAQFLQSVFYAFREEAFDVSMTQIQVVGGKLHTREAATAFHHPAFYAFPNNLIATADDKKAVLTMLCCFEPAAAMHQLVKKAFAGICSNTIGIVEVDVLVKRAHHRIVRHTALGIDNKTYHHSLMQVTLNDRSEFVLDLAGAQYGHYRAAAPWDNYINTYCEGGKIYRMFGSGHESLQKVIAGTEDLGPKNDPRIVAMLGHVSKVMHETVNAWEQSNNTTLAATLKLKLPEYTAGTATLLEDIVQELRACMVWWKSTQGPTAAQAKAWSTDRVEQAYAAYS